MKNYHKFNENLLQFGAYEIHSSSCKYIEFLNCLNSLQIIITYIIRYVYHNVSTVFYDSVFIKS